MYISKRSGMDHTVLPANTPRLPFARATKSIGFFPFYFKLFYCIFIGASERMFSKDYREFTLYSVVSWLVD